MRHRNDRRLKDKKKSWQEDNKEEPKNIEDNLPDGYCEEFDLEI